MSVRKRSWTTDRGEKRESWVVDYRDQHGDRHLKTFKRKRDADAHHAKVAIDVGAGTHTADSAALRSAKPADCGWRVGKRTASSSPRSAATASISICTSRR